VFIDDLTLSVSKGERVVSLMLRPSSFGRLRMKGSA
jgi:hypothetical protein